MQKDKELSRFYAFLAKPLFFRTRFVLALLVAPLVLSFTQPLWRIEVVAPEYPDGLSLDIYAHTIETGHDGADLRDLNVLNDYIGMRPLERHDLTDLDWLPFAIGLIAILALRCAAVGEVRSLVDVAVVTFYVGAFAVARFLYRLHAYGHDLSPDAPVKVEPFSPPLFGSRAVGAYTTTSGPGVGTWLLVAFAAGAVGILLYHLVVGRRRELGRGVPASPGELASAPDARVPADGAGGAAVESQAEREAGAAERAEA